MAIRFDLRDFNARTQRILNKIPTEVAAPAVEKTAKKIIGEAKAMTPVDTGRLRNSLSYDLTINGNSVSASMGSDVDYAIYVHEDLTKRHPFGQAKFLEKAIRRNVKTLEASVRERMRRLS